MLLWLIISLYQQVQLIVLYILVMILGHLQLSFLSTKNMLRICMRALEKYLNKKLHTYVRQ